MHGKTRDRASPLSLARFLACALLAGCTAPLQNGGVEVRAGAAERLGFLCRWRHGDVAAEPMCGANEARLPPARVGRVKEGERLGGASAEGALGDYRLENDEVVFVIDQRAGDLIDAADARVRCDALGRFRPLAALRSEGETRLTSGVESDGTAWVDVATAPSAALAASIVTRYSLRPGDRALLVSTALKSAKSESIGPVDLGDQIDWGAAAPAVQGAEGAPRDVLASALTGAGNAVAYATLPLDGSPISARNSAISSTTVLSAATRLGPGETAAIERVFVVAPRGDSLSIATEVFFLQGGAPGAIEVAFVDDAGQPVDLPAGLGLVLTPSESEGPLILRGAAVGCDASPSPPARALAAELPPGAYSIGAQPGRGVSAPPAWVTILPGEVTHAKLVLTFAPETEAAEVEPDSAPDHTSAPPAP